VFDSVDQSSTRARTANLTRKAVVRDGFPTEWAAGRSRRIEIFALKIGVARAEEKQARQQLTRGSNSAAGAALFDGFPSLAGMCSCD
jgi:hypothetical protein